MCHTGFTGNETYCEGKVIEMEVVVQMLAWGLNIPCETLVCQSCSLIHKEALVYTAIVAWWAWFTTIVSPHSVLLIPSLLSDVDECSENGTCPEHSTCANTFGSFVCTCNEGFMKDGSVCIGKTALSAL